jgi:hypothetical protein
VVVAAGRLPLADRWLARPGERSARVGSFIAVVASALRVAADAEHRDPVALVAGGLSESFLDEGVDRGLY